MQPGTKEFVHTDWHGIHARVVLEKLRMWEHGRCARVARTTRTRQFVIFFVVCQCFMVAQETRGQGYLKCEEGFKLDTTGETTKSCIDIDECKLGLVSCHVLAYCKNTEGSFQCVCQPGMYGNGHSCSSTAYAVRTVISVKNVTVDAFEKSWDAVKGLYGDLLSWGGTPLVERAMIDKGSSGGSSFSQAESRLAERQMMVDTMHKTAEFDSVFNTTTITMHALFANKPAAEAAVTRVIGYTTFSYYSFEWLFSWHTGVSVSVIDAPKVFAWQAGTSADPHRINPSGFNVEEVYFVRGCMQKEGCWVVDVTYATGARNTISVIYLSRVTEEDQRRLTPQTKATFRQNSFPCTSGMFDPTQLQRSNTACCLWDFVHKYRAVEAFEEWVTQHPQLVKACNMTDNVQQTPKSSILNGLRDFATGTFANLTHSKVIDRGMIGMHGDMRAARILLHEGELKSMVGVLKDGVGQKSKAECFVGIAHLTPTGAKFMDGAGHQKRLALDRFDKNSFIAIDNSQRMQIDAKPWFSVEGDESQGSEEGATEETEEEGADKTKQEL